MSKANPSRKIYFFKNDIAPIVYVFMSLVMDRDAFFEMFEHAIEITEKQADDYVLKKDHKVVYVGDDHIIDKYFIDAVKDQDKSPQKLN